MNRLELLNNSRILVGDALDVLRTLPDQYADCCVTSPPYYGLRDYGVDGQIGLEQTPEKYISRLVEVFREVHRVLKDDGTLWVNIADSYAGSGKGGAIYPDNAAKYKQGTNRGMLGAVNTTKPRTPGIKPKDMIGIPWMLAFALRADGWYLRQDIIWHKTNCMPESVRDRCTKSHEYIFLLSKSRRYYFDAEEIKEPAVGFENAPLAEIGKKLKPNAHRRKGNAKSFRGGGAYTGGKSFYNSAVSERESHGNTANLTGLRNRRDVWNVSTQGYKGAHFATFPEKLIEPCILAGSREGGVVIDPFFGSGTTGKVAIDNGRAFVGIDINAEYGQMASERTRVEVTVR